MEELIAIVRELIQAVHVGEKRQETLNVLDNLLKDITSYKSSDVRSTANLKAAKGANKVDTTTAQPSVLDDAPFVAIHNNPSM